jgi:hypothetical protein
MALRKDRIVREARVISILVAVSLLLYVMHFVWFKDLHHIWLWSFTSLAFLPVSALFVTLLINRVLSARDKALRLEKLNMLIGLFFSDLGNELLLRFSDADPEDQYLRNHFGSPKPWSKLQPKQAQAILHRHRFGIAITRNELADLKAYIIPHTEFLMRLMENPNLIEHESFTQLLRAVFHLKEELSYREDLETISDSDVHHLCGDIERVYSFITGEWVQYMIFLKSSFPYLFSLAVRANTLDRSALVSIPEKEPPSSPRAIE